MDLLDDGVLRAVRRKLALHQAESIHAHARDLSLGRRRERAGGSALSAGLHARDRQVPAERAILERESRRAQTSLQARGELLQLSRALAGPQPQDAGPPRIRKDARASERQGESAQRGARGGRLAQARQGVPGLLAQEREREVQLLVLRPGERRVPGRALHLAEGRSGGRPRPVRQRNAEEEPHAPR